MNLEYLAHSVDLDCNEGEIEYNQNQNSLIWKIPEISGRSNVKINVKYFYL